MFNIELLHIAIKLLISLSIVFCAVSVVTSTIGIYSKVDSNVYKKIAIDAFKSSILAKYSAVELIIAMCLIGSSVSESFKYLSSWFTVLAYISVGTFIICTLFNFVDSINNSYREFKTYYLLVRIISAVSAVFAFGISYMFS